MDKDSLKLKGKRKKTTKLFPEDLSLPSHAFVDLAQEAGAWLMCNTKGEMADR